MAATAAKATNGRASTKSAEAAKQAADSKTTVPSAAPTVSIDRLAQETMLVPILGTTPLIVHQFSQKAKQQMLDAMQGRKSPKSAKDPAAEYESAFYRRGDGDYGFPSNGFKLATVDASRFYGKDVTKVGLRQTLFMFGEGHDLYARIEGEPHMREDVVRVGQGGTDLRYRPEFPEWSTTLEVIYFPDVITRGSVLSLIDAGGMGVGVGEWRPARDGINGTYCVDPDREVRVIETASR